MTWRRVVMMSCVAVAVVFYQNCDHRENIDPTIDPLVVKIDDQPRVFSQLEPSTLSEVCLQSSYVCVEKTFQPDLPYGSSEEQKCFSLTAAAGPTEICARVLHFTYDSASALAHCEDCTPDDGKPGGQFNYKEVQCYHSAVVSQMSQRPGLIAEGLDIGETLSRVVNTCIGAGGS